MHFSLASSWRQGRWPGEALLLPSLLGLLTSVLCCWPVCEFEEGGRGDGCWGQVYSIRRMASSLKAPSQAKLTAGNSSPSTGKTSSWGHQGTLTIIHASSPVFHQQGSSREMCPRPGHRRPGGAPWTNEVCAFLVGTRGWGGYSGDPSRSKGALYAHGLVAPREPRRHQGISFACCLLHTNRISGCRMGVLRLSGRGVFVEWREIESVVLPRRPLVAKMNWRGSRCSIIHLCLWNGGKI